MTVAVFHREDGASHAPPLVLVHSLGTDLHSWDPQVPELARRFRVIRYDARGHGASPVSREPVTIERLALDLVDLLDRLSIDAAHVCGLSLGGVTGMWLAAHHPERVRRLVLANTGARIGSPELWQARMDAVREGGMGVLRDGVVTRFLGTAFREANPDMARAIGDMFEATPVDGYVAACAALSDADLRADLASIRAPTLVIGGDSDVSTPPTQSVELHEAIAGSELVVLPDTPHLSNVVRPTEFTRLLTEFLEERHAD